MLAGLVNGWLGSSSPSTAGARPAPSGPARPVATALDDVTMVSGGHVRLPFRVDVVDAAEVRVRLVIATPGGDAVRTLLKDEVRPANTPQAWTGRLAIAPGEYRYVVYATTLDGRSQQVTIPAKLIVKPAPFPAAAAITRALAWAGTRAGSPAVAVVSSDGSVRGLNMTSQYRSYSLSKAMMLVAYLRAHATVDDWMRDTLERMIEHSDNGAADVVFAQIGGGMGLAAFARTVGMKGFTPGASWIDCRVTAQDQAKFFFAMDRWVPAAHRAFVHELLNGVTPRQRWGIPAAGEPLGWAVYFKGGWSPGNTDMTQGARLERNGKRFALAILTQGNPAWTYGFGTLKGVTGLLLGQQITDAYVAQVL